MEYDFEKPFKRCLFVEIFIEIFVQLLAEGAAVLFQIFGQILGEMILQILGEAVVEAGIHSIREPFKAQKDRSPFIAAIGYFLLGLIIGGISVLAIPTSLIGPKPYRILNLMFTPVFAGLCMSVIGSYRLKRSQDLIRLDSFFYGYLFALGMGLVRFLFATG